jgi:hypothetical protein
MTQRLLPFSLLGLLFYSVAAFAIVAPVGCGGGEEKTGPQVAVPAQETQAQNAMEDFMKSQSKKKK